jgi:folate-dependent phosphoribosylglycinamide formyltransferase PurN
MLCNPSPNQRALANRLHAVVPLTGIALVTPRPGKFRPGPWRRLKGVLLGLPMRTAWFGMQAHYEQLYPDWPTPDTTRHDGVNSESIAALAASLKPDLVIVSGTDLLKQPLIDAISATGRILNLHTGISPFIKGGPNCTNWCLAIEQPELIGNTMMWIDAGIDSGNIATTEQTPLHGITTLTKLHIAVMDHAHDLYCRTVARLRDGQPVPSVPQHELGEGRLFLTAHWTGENALRAWLNFRRMVPLTTQPPRHRLVALDELDRAGSGRSAAVK